MTEEDDEQECTRRLEGKTGMLGVCQTRGERERGESERKML